MSSDQDPHDPDAPSAKSGGSPTPNAGSGKKAKGGKSGPAALVPIVPTPMAAVFDANLWGQGTLDIDQLSKHAKRLAKSGVELWVPTQIMLEWAAHTAADAANAAPVWNRLRRAGMVTGKFPAVSEIAAVVSAVKAKLAAIPNVKILPTTGDAAIAGLEDQILGTGPGESRNGVKTGGVDSAWVRDALAAASNDPSKLLFVTKNAKDVHATAKAAGVGPVNVRSEHNLYASLFGASAAPDKLALLIAGHVQELLYDPAQDPDFHGYPAESLLPVQDITLAEAVFDYPEPFEITEIALDPAATVVGMVAVDIIESPDEKSLEAQPEGSAAVQKTFNSTVEFQLLILTNLDVAGYELDQDGQVHMQSAVAYATVVLAPVIADIEDLHVSLTATGEATAQPAEQRFSEASDALGWLLGELAVLSGIQLENDDISLDEFVFNGVDGVTVVATLDGDAYDEWTLSFSLADDVVSVTCHFDPGARVWAGPDSFDSRPPYYLTSDGTDILWAEPYTTIGRVWKHLNGL